MVAEGRIGPAEMIPYGAPVRARDIENYRGADPGMWLTELSRVILQAAVTAEHLDYVVPQVTDRIEAPDGGIDASLTIRMTLPGPRSAGLVNPDTTIYQFKWRSNRNNIFRPSRGELKKLKDSGRIPEFYVFVTNIDLTIEDKNRVGTELRNDCEEFPSNHIVILGAGELADRVNNDPRIRVTHFDIGVGLCTLEVARAAAKRRYRNLEPPGLFIRESELSNIKGFVFDPESRVLVVHGPQGVGKTRIVLEALSSVSDRVVWARGIPAQPTGLIHVLDDSPYPAILVVDDVEEQPIPLLNRALEAAHLKTIIICLWHAGAPGVIAVPINPLSSFDTDRFLGEAFPSMSLSQRYWLFEQFGGLPGLLLQGGVALQSAIGPDPLREPSYNDLLQAYEDRMIGGLGTDATAAIEALSVLPQVTVPQASVEDLRAVCDALRIDLVKVLKHLELLKTRNLIEQVGVRGSFIRVTPPLLARRIVKRVMTGLAGQLPALYSRLSQKAKAGLIRRAAELQNDGNVQRFLNWLIFDTGILTDVSGVATNSATIRALAETIPILTARELRRVLEEATVQDRHDLLAGDDRREIVNALEVLIHRQGTFEDGARGLLCLAEAENEIWGNNATGIFTKIFHWRLPDIPMDGRLRASLLSYMAGSDLSKRRVLVAKAAAQCLETSFVFRSGEGLGVAPPESGWQPTLWAEVHDAVRPVVELLKRLAIDPGSQVRNEAIHALSKGVEAIRQVGLIEEAVAALEFLERLSLDGSQRASVVEGASFLVINMTEAAKGAQDAQWRKTLEEGINRGEALFTQMTSVDFPSRFMHWLGPNPLRAHRRMGEEAEVSEIAEQGKRLAEEVISDPTLFTPDLQDWITGEHAKNSGHLLYPLGKLDRGQAWLGPLEKRLDRPLGVGALGIYVLGWFSADQDEVEDYLNTISGRGSKWSETAADATWRIGGSPSGVDRLLKCVSTGGTDRASLGRMLWCGAWYKDLNIDDLLRLVKGLRDETREVDWALLELLQRRWLSNRNEWATLGPLAADMLSKTAPIAYGHEAYEWDSFAAALVEWDEGAGFELLFAHRNAGEESRGIWLTHDRTLLISALSAADRPRVVRNFLKAAVEGPDPHKVAMELPELLHPETDMPVLLQSVEEFGPEVAALLARKLDADQPGFWDMLPSFIAKFGNDPDVRSHIIHNITWIHGVYSSRAATLRQRLEPLEKLCTHTTPLVQLVARQAKVALLEEIEGGDPM